MKYAQDHKLLHKAGWVWLEEYIYADEKLANIFSTYRASTEVAKYKFGVQVPRNPKHALELDRQNGDDLWKEATQKELDQINEYETFRVLQDHELVPPGYKRIPYHIIFDIKFDLH